MNLSVEDSGYLKDAKISIKEAEENKGLNFKLKKEELLPENVQSMEDNTLELYPVNSYDDEISIEVPIEFKYEKYFDESNLSKDFLVVLNGTYIDGKGNEKEIYKEVPLKISWKDERSINVETEIEKYIDYGEGVVVQSKVTLDNSTDLNTLPVKSTELTIDVPKYQDVSPSDVLVVANSTKGTNGETVGELSFDEDNWEYNEEEGKLTINLENEKQKVVVNEYEDDLLQNMDKEIVEEERYYNISGSDEYLITYTYENVEKSEDVVDIDTDVKAEITLFSGVEEENNENIITNDDKAQNRLVETNNNLVSINLETVTDNVSKAYFYSNLENDNYEIELNSKTVINISRDNIIESLEVEDIDNVYVYEEDLTADVDDIYYKGLSISKDNFVELLGNDGEIKVTDLSGNSITTIKSNSSVDEEGNIVVDFDENYSKIKLQISKPTGEGNLVITNRKAIKEVSASKELIAKSEYISSSVKLTAKYEYVDAVEPKTAENRIKLNDTKTNPILVMNRDSLSTLSLNENVEIKIELNNAVEESDLYGHSEFEIEFPEGVESIAIKDADSIDESGLLSGEGLKITSVDVEGRTIKVVLDGKQDGINSSIVTKGTNIVLRADIKVNLYTPSKSETIKLRVNNSEATNYENDGESELPIVYSAPTGVVTVNSTYNYNDNGDVITSVKQGKQTDLLDIYSSSKVATMELIVMNNNSNNVSDFSILGRFPFEGVTDILTGDDLETTITPKLVKGIEADLNNNIDFEIYYSSNEDASKDINKEENGWTKDLSLEEAKSFLILPADENYLMEPYTVLRFTYEYEIPEQLPHNENIFGTFVAYYTNISDVAITREESAADLVGLTTGNGPEVSLSLETSKKEIRELEELRIKIVAKNIGKDRADDVTVEYEIPENASYVDCINENENIETNIENKKITMKVARLEPADEAEITVVIKANKITSESVIKTEATITAKDLGTILTEKADDVSVLEAEFEIVESEKIGTPKEDVYIVGKELTYTIRVRNITTESFSNVLATKVLPEEFELIRAYAKLASGEEIEATYENSTRTIRWNVAELPASAVVTLKANVKVASLDSSLLEKKVTTSTIVSANNTEAYESNAVTVLVARPSLEISQETANTNTYVKEGSIINYTFKVKNVGSAQADNVVLKEMIPEGINIKDISYVLDNKQASKNAATKTEAIVKALYISPGSELTVNVKAIAGALNGAQEKTVTNYALVSAEGISEQETNSITHIIEASERNQIDPTLEKSTSSTKSSSSSSNITKTYKIEGLAWLDKNKDGMRNAGEEVLSGITVQLVNNENRAILKTTTTDSAGSYTFAGVENGKYAVLFDFDTIKYAITTYKKEGVAANVNSDVTFTKFEQEGKMRNVAITDEITVLNGSISCIDMGVILADVFDLQIDKSITKVTVQTSAGTTTDNYNGAKLVKSEIATKQLAGATVYVEYEITVTNVGDIPGYAKKIVDYIPSGMTFNSTLGTNSNWYTGSNNDLFNNELENKELAKGQSATVKLVLTRQMTTENTDIVSNMAEIYEDYNRQGVSDKNSVPANKAQGENDLSSADIAILVKTGETFINISVIMMTLMLMVIVAFVVYGKVKEIIRRKEGV